MIALMLTWRVFGYVISDSGRYSVIGYPDIQIPVEITSVNSYWEINLKGGWLHDHQHVNTLNFSMECTISDQSYNTRPMPVMKLK